APPLPPPGPGGDADGDLAADPVPGGRGAAPAHAARAVGVRRPPLAADPRPGLLQPAPPAAGPARPELRVHAPVRADGGPHLELPPHPRPLPLRPALRRAAAGAQAREREPAGDADHGPRRMSTP